jgi:hypothetical protein
MLQNLSNMINMILMLFMLNAVGSYNNIVGLYIKEFIRDEMLEV